MWHRAGHCVQAHSTAPQASSAHCDLELENLETLTWQVGRKKQKESAPILYPYASLVNPIILRQEARVRVDQLSAWAEVASESFQERWFEARVDGMRKNVYYS